jgi:hypothetical protein
MCRRCRCLSRFAIVVACGFLGFIPQPVAAQTDTVIETPAAATAPASASPDAGRSDGTALDPITPDAAAAQVGRQCTVEMTVRSARHIDDKEMCFLNSAKRHRDEGNFTVVIFKTGMGRLREAGITKPADHYLDRTIRVRGVVQLRDERPQIVVEDAMQIELVDEPAAAR